MTPIPYIIAILIFGMVGSYTDIKKGVIKNKMILAMLVTKISIDAALIFTKNAELGELLITYINISIGLLISIVFWIIKLWSPGDAKFFTMMIGFIPVSAYSDKWLIVIDLLPFILMPALIILVTAIIFKSSRQQKIDAIKKILEPEKIISSILSVFWIWWSISLLEGLVSIKINYAIYIITYFIMNALMDKFLKKHKLRLSVFLSILRLIFDYQQIIRIDFWINFTVSIMIFFVILGAITLLSEILFVPKIKRIENIVPGTTSYQNFKITRNIDLKKFLIRKITKKNQFFNPNYSYEKNIAYFTEIIRLSKTKKFPENNNYKYLLSKDDRELDETRLKILKNSKITHIIVEDSTIFGPYIFLGIMIFLVNHGIRNII